MKSSILYEQKKIQWKSLPLFIQIICFLVVNADIPRYDDSYEAKFYDVHKGRLFPIIKAFGKQMSLEECAYACIQFLDCESINYNDELNLCELCNDVYDEYEAIEDPSDSWYNYATPPKQDGDFTQWSQWNPPPQRKTCEITTQTRNRTCTNPSPDFGGADCYGNRFERRSKRNFPCSSKQNDDDICYSKGKPKGFFEAKYTGVIKEVVFYHKSGSIRCEDINIDAYWGCVKQNENCAIHHCFSMYIIEEESGRELVPYAPDVEMNSNGNYNLHPYTDAKHDNITLKVKQRSFNVTRGKEYYVTLSAYRGKKVADLTGGGRHCIDVEFIYTSII